MLAARARVGAREPLSSTTLARTRRRAGPIPVHRCARAAAAPRPGVPLRSRGARPSVSVGRALGAASGGVCVHVRACWAGPRTACARAHLRASPARLVVRQSSREPRGVRVRVTRGRGSLRSGSSARYWRAGARRVAGSTTSLTSHAPPLVTACQPLVPTITDPANSSFLVRIDGHLAPPECPDCRRGKQKQALGVEIL
jgi:hypothetical protein